MLRHHRFRTTWQYRLGTVVVILLWIAGTAAKTQDRPTDGVDLAIVVSLDRSESIDQDDARAQIRGLIYTLHNDRFLAAATSGEFRRIALSVITWSSFGKHGVLLPWMRIGRQDEADRAARVIALDRFKMATDWYGALTDVAFGIETGVQQMSVLPWPARRRVINVVADGVSNIGRLASIDRDIAVRHGITVNGLVMGQGSAIRILKEYFHREVIGGPSAFVQVSTSNQAFSEAMLRKMLVEIALLSPPRNGP